MVCLASEQSIGPTRPGLANVTEATWGASPIMGDDGRWRIFHAQLSHHCGIMQAWLSNSFIGRSVSTSGDIGGPYQFEHQAVPEFAHNPQIRKVADGYALFMIGGWQMELCHCKHPLDSTQCKLGGPVVRNR